jgi:hypothetical protein
VHLRMPPVVRLDDIDIVERETSVSLVHPSVDALTDWSKAILFQV